jgi:hypothetical protein
MGRGNNVWVAITIDITKIYLFRITNNFLKNRDGGGLKVVSAIK